MAYPGWRALGLELVLRNEGLFRRQRQGMRYAAAQEQQAETERLADQPAGGRAAIVLHVARSHLQHRQV